ncbi:amino acid ABC transporter permease [Acidisoma silvae]|uniref:Glutamate/aspartate import permease protein GltK n=1 Tax=Acidisoma silvae TaxID=2802396 RepID=A0A964E175_9PROT|nr:amino acid ABC transporter permease [Acidisoma silvae]MCB8878056.1 amino acid ABC transporter permease [Acidisoma silvae]
MSAQSAGAVILPRRQPSRWIGLPLIGVIIAWMIYQVLTNHGFQWTVVWHYLFEPTILVGVGMTLALTVLVMAIGIICGGVLALVRFSPGPMLPLCARAYIWFFRGTPVLVQLVFWYNLASLFPQISFGIPFGGPKLFAISATAAISSFTAALLGLGLNEAAYMAEIVRAGLLSVDRGQSEASKALGYRPAQTFRVVILPQAMRAIVPPTGNQIIGMLKYTSLASVVGLGELMQSVENIYASNFQTIPLLIVAALWYLLLVGLLSIAQSFIERYYAFGTTAGEGAR